ncbi:MAG: L,D-transpeptidase [Akkermansiaceae bacterium]
MKTFISPLSLLLFAGALLLSSCGGPPPPNPDQTVIKAAQKVNPYASGTYEHFKFDNYPYTTRTWKNNVLLAKANPSNTNIRLDLGKQRGFLMVGNQVAMDYRISSGRSSHKTPTGDYRILEKTKDKRSNLYGKIYDAEEKVINSDADVRTDEVPEGGKFVGASMQYWMRLTPTGIGMHKGNVNRRYASHGCIRSHYSAVPIVFSKVKVGTPVSVVP